MNPNITENKLVALVPEIEHLNNFETILDTLNQLGNELGYSFKKGQMAPNIGKSIMCKYYDRNKLENSTKYSKIRSVKTVSFIS